ncbi:MAG: site-specific integrase [Blastocatellia bacterium]|nr:site-specific integrase [Blastocatellia bacterium]
MSVYKRKTSDGKNRWYFDVKIKGVRYRGVIPEARTKFQAQEAERRIRDEIFNGKFGKSQSKKTLAQFARETYLPWSREHKRSWRNDFSRIKPILAYFGKKKMSEISPFEVERFKTIRSKSEVREGVQRSKAAVNRELALLSRLFTLAISKREISFNPVSEVKFLKGEVRRTRYLLPEEEERLMAEFTGKRAHLRLIVAVALNTGMRKSEILKLKRSDLDFIRGEILVTETKNGEDRIVPMNERLRGELLSHLANHSSEYVFVNPKTGRPRVALQHAFESARDKAGLVDFRFHDLRHTAATRMNEAGIDPYTIAAILGHKQIEMTASYTHATEAAKRRAVEALGTINVEVGTQIGHMESEGSRLTLAK